MPDISWRGGPSLRRARSSSGRQPVWRTLGTTRLFRKVSGRSSRRGIAFALAEVRTGRIWFGAVFTMNIQASFQAPPVGPAVFCLKSVAPPDISLGEIFQSLLPVIALQIVALGLMLVPPGITLIEGL